MPASALRLKWRGVLQAGGRDTRGQAELRVIGDSKRLVVVLAPDHGGNRAKDLLAGDAHLIGAIGKERGRLEEPVCLAGTARSPPTTRRAPSDLPISM